MTNILYYSTPPRITLSTHAHEGPCNYVRSLDAIFLDIIRNFNLVLETMQTFVQTILFFLMCDFKTSICVLF